MLILACCDVAYDAQIAVNHILAWESVLWHERKLEKYIFISVQFGTSECCMPESNIFLVATFIGTK